MRNIIRSFFILTLILVLVASWLSSGLSVLADVGFVKNIGTNQTKSAGTSISVTVPAAGVKAGNSIIVTFAMDSDAGSVSVSDSQGNSYNADADVTHETWTIRTLIFSAHNVTALASGDTITVTHPSVNARAVSAAEFSGLAKLSTLDKTSTGSGNSTTPSSGSTATTSQADELLIGAIGVETTVNESFTPGSGYTALSRAGTSSQSASSNITINPEYRIVSVTGMYAADGTIEKARNWAAAIATYKMLVWDSYSDSAHTTQCDYFDDYATEHIAYMYGTGFAASTNYRVIFWDGSGVNAQTEDTSSDGAGDLSAAHTLVVTDTAGNWNVAVYTAGADPASYDPNDANLVADDTTYTGSYAFYVAASAIPEFPTILAGIGVAILCFGIYWWMRKRRLARIKA